MSFNFDPNQAGMVPRFYVNRESAARETRAFYDADKQVKLANLATETPADKSLQGWLQLYLNYTEESNKALVSMSKDKIPPALFSCRILVSKSLNDGTLATLEPDKPACE